MSARKKTEPERVATALDVFEVTAGIIQRRGLSLVFERGKAPSVKLNGRPCIDQWESEALRVALRSPGIAAMLEAWQKRRDEVRSAMERALLARFVLGVGNPLEVQRDAAGNIIGVASWTSIAESESAGPPRVGRLGSADERRRSEGGFHGYQ